MRITYSIICFVACSLFFQQALAQDIIITTDHDTLDAKVIKITESTTSYKLVSYLDGPTYELGNARIGKIIYENGEEFSFDNGNPQGAPLYDHYKNSVEFIATELVMLRASAAYSRYISKNFEVKVGASISFVDVTHSYGNPFENFGEIQLNYHPLSYRRLDYYIGLRGRMGNARSYSYYYEPYYYYDSYYAPTATNSVVGTIGVINGAKLHFNQRFSVNAALSLDIYLEEGRGAIRPMPGAIFGVGYHF